MSDLTAKERRALEAFLGMGTGYVLNFSHRTYAMFFAEEVGLNIDDPKFHTHGISKAKRMRSFWDQEDNWAVAKCLTVLMDLAREEAWPAVMDSRLLEPYLAVLSRLSTDQPVTDLAAIAAEPDERDFDAVAKAAREAIEKNQPEAGLDRLHTFVVKFFRKLCDDRGMQLDRNVPLNGLVGAYVKAAKEQGMIGSDMCQRAPCSIEGAQASVIRGKHKQLRLAHWMSHSSTSPTKKAM